MLLRLTTIIAVFFVWVPVAQAWTWPVQGPVLQGFSFDESHPYAAGQHRGIDIGAPATGGPVVAPANGTVSYAGTVPTSGKSVTIETSDGYSVTLTHLGSIAVTRGATVAEGTVVGTVGPSGKPEQSGPYVHLGIRTTADANGYLDPLSLLPPLVSPPPPPTTVSNPPTHHTRPASSRGGIVIRHRASASASTSAPTAARTDRASRPSRATSSRHRPETKRPTVHRVQNRTVQRPVVETTPTLVVHTAPPLATSSATPDLSPRQQPASQPLQLGLAAGPGLLAGLAAIATALIRVRRRRRDGGAAVILRLHAPAVEREGATRSAA